MFGETDSIAAWMLDSACTWFGITIENALQERVKVGMGKEDKPKYTLARLLSQGFKLPAPMIEVGTADNPWLPLLAWVGKRNSKVKRYEYRPPAEKKVDDA